MATYPSCALQPGYAKIYTLSDNEGNVFYVGMTSGPLENRVDAHIADARLNKPKSNQRKNEKIASLNYKITATIVDKVWVSNVYSAFSSYRCRQLEDEWMQKFLDAGAPLLNIRMPKKKRNYITEEIGQSFTTA